MTTPVQRRGLQDLTNSVEKSIPQGKGIKASAAPLKKPLIAHSASNGKVTKVATSVKPKSSSADISKKPKPSRVVVEKATLAEHKDPVKIEIHNEDGHIRRIYSRDFLIKFRYTVTAFPPGVPSPADIIAQYNKEYEQREAAAYAQAQQQSHADNLSSLSTNPTTTTTPATPSSSITSSGAAVPASPAATAAPKKRDSSVKKSATAAQNAFKLRIKQDDAVLHRPMFNGKLASSPARAASNGKIAPSMTSSAATDDKENQIVQQIRIAPNGKATPDKATVAIKPVSVLPSPKPKTPKAAVAKKAEVAPSPKVVLDKENVPEIPSAANVDTKPDQEVKMDNTVELLTKKLIAVLKESDPRRLAQRQKQIDFGKNTNGYQEYTKLVLKSRRRRDDPKTPPKHQVCSKRSWDGQIRKWRRMLHQYDPSEPKTFEDGPDMEGEDSDIEIEAADEVITVATPAVVC